MPEPGVVVSKRKLFWMGTLAFLIPLCMIPIAVLRFSRPLQHALPLWLARYSGFILIGALCLGCLVGTIVFIVDAALNRRLTTTSKSIWIAGMVIMGPLPLPFYWWIHLFRAPRPA